VKKQKLIDGLYTVFRDVYHISECEEIAALPSTRSESGKKLLIKYDKGKSTVVLSSPHRDIIISVSEYVKIIRL
jgi:neurofibromin 1